MANTMIIKSAAAGNVAPAAVEIFNDYNNNQAGIKGYYFTSFEVDANNNTIATLQLSTQQSSFNRPLSIDYELSDIISYVYGSKYYNVAKIIDIDELNSTIKIQSVTNEKLETGTITANLDGQIVFVLNKPKVGAVALGHYAHAEGHNTKAYGWGSHAEGRDTQAIGVGSHTEGRRTIAYSYGHAEGQDTKALGSYSHAEGYKAEASGDYSHAENQAKAYGSYSHAENNGQSNGSHSHAEGNSSCAEGVNSHAEGESTVAFGKNSHAEGQHTKANGEHSHAEGVTTEAGGMGAHAAGLSTKALGDYSHSEGTGSTASGKYSHAEGSSAQASGEGSHAEGFYSHASGNYSHAEGYQTIATGAYSYAGGKGCITTDAVIPQFSIGSYNLRNDNAVLTVGIGTEDAVRKNGFVIQNTGDVALPQAGTGIHLTSPNGTIYKLTISNEGELGIVAL